MAVASSCPDPQQLQQLLLGRLPRKEAQRLEQHVEHCDRCGRLLPSLPADDALAQAMRAKAKFGLHPSDLDVVEGLVRRLQKQKAAAVSVTDTVTGEHTKGDAKPMSDKPESFDFLAPAESASEIGRLGKYRVLKLLGQGGMGLVFQAEDPKLQRAIALKVMLPALAANASAKERFLREARATAAIEHDHIVTIHQVDEDRGVPFLAMQMLKGMSLEDYLKKAKQTNKPLTLGQILKLGREIARGLAAAHERGLIHRDIKPANVWLDATAGGRVKILDFGLARPQATDSTITQSGMIVGTPAYMAPEQAAGQKVDGRADLFSLGCVLYRLCSGRLPWKGETAMATLMAVATEEATPLQELNPRLPPKLVELVTRLLAKKPEDRPKSAKAVVETIVAMEKQLAADKVPVAQSFQVEPSQWQQLGGQSETAPVVKVRKPIEKRLRRWPLVAVAAALLLIGGGVALWQVIIRVEDKQGKRLADLSVPTGSKVEIDRKGVVTVNLPDPGAGQGAALKPGEIDLLKLIDPKKHAVKGQWRFDKQSLVTPKELPAAKPVEETAPRLQIPFAPPPEYELEIVATRTEGNDSLVVGLVAGGRQFEAALDGYGGTVAGLALLDWKKIHENETTVKAKVFTNGQASTIVIGVDRQGVTIRADRKTIIAWKGDFNRLTIHPAWAVPDPKQLWVGAWDSTFHIHKLVLRPRGDVPPSGSGVDHAWIKAVQAMPPQKQVEAVAAKLKDLNPDFDEKTWKPKIENGEVRELKFSADAVSDISPVRALVHLRSLECRGTLLQPPAPPKGKIANLAPLRGMSLEILLCSGNPIADLSPLQGMPLTYLSIHHTAVTDLTPLKGLRLKHVNVASSRVSDLAPLTGMPLEEVICCWSLVADLSPLKGMQLTQLNCQGTAVTDLSLLKDMPLAVLHCNFVPGRDGAILRSIKTLDKINGQPAAEFLNQAAAANAAFEQWVKDTQKLPAEKQVEAVAAKLKELNPGFDGKVTHKIEGGVVTELKFFSDSVTDISPVRGLAGLKTLHCPGELKKSQFADLGQLKGILLTRLNVINTSVSDLSPLQGMNVKGLSISWTRVTDLSPLKGLPLNTLDCNGINVADLSPLKGMPLEVLVAQRLPISDLSPLKGMPLTYLDLGWTTKITDLSPLTGMKLRVLGSGEAKIDDLSPLQGMPLETLWCKFKPGPDTEFLRSIKTLKKINGKPAADFWKEVDATKAAFEQWIKDTQKLPAEKQVEEVAAKLKELNPGFDGKVMHRLHNDGKAVRELSFITDSISDISPVRALAPRLEVVHAWGSAVGKGRLADLSPLRGLQLRRLDLGKNQVADLTPLAGMPLTWLAFSANQVADLAPLKGMPLTVLYGDVTKFSDLTPLKGMPLQELHCCSPVLKDLTPLKGMKLTLLNISGSPVSDLSPLEGMPLTTLWAHATSATDLAPLKGMPLRQLSIRPDAGPLDVLRSIKTLEKINDQPAAEFLSSTKPVSVEFMRWVKDTQKLLPEKQVEAVAKKLQELNPGFDGKVTHKVWDGAVKEVVISSEKITNISPIRALPQLAVFQCYGTFNARGRLSDLSPLLGLDQLWAVHVQNNPVKDLGPLKGLRLKNLDIGGTAVTDLTPVAGMPLLNLWCGWSEVTSLAPIKGSKLKSLDCRGTKIDLATLPAFPLEDLLCDFDKARHTEILRSMKALEKINGKPAAEFLKQQ
jgi:serine/threonine protein kinase/Leucine-rich repeat (LRR) protein